MSSFKRTQRPAGDVRASVSLSTTRKSIITTAKTDVKSVKVTATPAQDGSFTPKARASGSVSVVVEQTFHQVTKYEKQNALKNVIKENDGKRILVFVEKKRNADFLAVLLCEQQLPTSSIHGDRVRRDRERALLNFESGLHRILVATTAALDIKNVDIVVNYDLPKTIDKYVKRIGRTGSVSYRGKAVSFYDVKQDAGLVADLYKVLRQVDQPIPDFLQGGGTDRPILSDKYKKGSSNVRNSNTSAAVSGGQEADEDC